MHRSEKPSRRALLLVVLCGLCATGDGARGQVLGLGPNYRWSAYFSDPSDHPTSLTVDDQNRIYFATTSGRIRVIEDLNGDRVAETVTEFWNGTGLWGTTAGILWHQGRIYVSFLGGISTIEDTNGDLVGDVKVDLITGLPFGFHQNNQLFTDGTFLYFGLGSVSDHDVDPNPFSATLMRMNADGTNLIVYAAGLRNVYDGVVLPQTGDILVADNGPNLVPGFDHPPDEVNLVTQGAHFGHPFNWGIPPTPVHTSPLLELMPHSGPTGMAVNPNLGISGYRNEVVLCNYGSISGPIPAGHLLKISVLYPPAGGPPRLDAHVFQVGASHPIDCVFDQAGILYVADYGTDTVYQVYQDTPAVTIIEGTGAVGSVTPITLSAPSFPNHLVLTAASTGTAPPLFLGPTLAAHLDTTSWLYWFSITPGNGIFTFPFPGTLSSTGIGSASVAIPPILSLAGISLPIEWVVVTPNLSSFVAVAPIQSLHIVAPL